MAIASFDKDIEVIQKLDDEPNDVQGLTPEELKQKFDQAAIWLKEYINTVLLPGITGTGSTGGGSGASNIGAGVDDFPGSDVQAILNAFNDCLLYTSDIQGTRLSAKKHCWRCVTGWSSVRIRRLFSCSSRGLMEGTPTAQIRTASEG